MPSRIDGNLAFMPTSNDALVAANDLRSPLSRNGSSYGSPVPTKTSERASSVISPPLHSLDAVSSSLPNTPSLTMASVSQRGQVSSSSELPSFANVGIHSPDQDTWHTMYDRLLQAHDQERAIWRMERHKLQEEIAALKQDLVRSGTRNDSNASTTSNMPSANTRDNQFFFDPTVVKNANEKLRQYSQVSPTNGQTPRDSSIGEDAARKSSMTQRLPSILEDDSSNKTVRIDDRDSVEIATAGSVEDPVSPPTTARGNLSPPPENFRLHAGHTPKVVRGVREGPVLNLKHPAMAQSVYQADGPDEDRELSSPKFLSTDPDINHDTLDDLSRKLRDIAEDPDAHPPEALRCHEEQEVAPVPAAANTSDAAVAGGGIRLKKTEEHEFWRALGISLSHSEAETAFDIARITRSCIPRLDPGWFYRLGIDHK